MEATTAPKAKRPRSPGYPGIGLQEAIERARVLYDRERQNWSHVDVTLGHWGYKPKSGAGLVVLASLKKFGLVEDEGSGESRRARLSDLALDIVLDTRPDSAERRVAIQTAALAPPIHRELWDKYSGSLPSDEGLAFYLIRERRFTEAGAHDLIGEFRGTIAFAGLTHEGDSVSRQDQDTPAFPEEPPITPPATQAPENERPDAPVGGGPATSPQQRSVQLPVPGTSWVTLQGAFPITDDAWNQMIRLLEAMKPGLVVPSTGPEGTE